MSKYFANRRRLPMMGTTNKAPKMPARVKPSRTPTTTTAAGTPHSHITTKSTLPISKPMMTSALKKFSQMRSS